MVFNDNDYMVKDNKYVLEKVQVYKVIALYLIGTVRSRNNGDRRKINSVSMVAAVM